MLPMIFRVQAFVCSHYIAAIDNNNDDDDVDEDENEAALDDNDVFSSNIFIEIDAFLWLLRGFTAISVI